MAIILEPKRKKNKSSTTLQKRTKHTWMPSGLIGDRILIVPIHLRVAKAFVNDLAVGCYDQPPKITTFDNVDHYDGLVFQGNIKTNSFCSHHHLPFIGQTHVAYIPGKDGKVIGLSKLNRIVEWFSRRPQVQENLTMQIHKYINEVCEDNKGVAVLVEANHTCAGLRGVKHDSTMKTARMSGAFLDREDINTRQEFYDFVRDLKR